MQSQRTTVHHLAQVIGTMTSLNQAVLPLTLQGLTRAQKQTSGPPPLIRFSDLAESESDEGFEVLDRSWESVESGTDSHQPTGPNNRVGCLRPGLGCNLFVQQGCNRRSLEQSGVASSYQLQGAPSCMAGSPCYPKNMRNCHVHLKIDNTAAVAYINKMGGAPSRDLCQLALRMWNWCIDHHITISAEHLPGSQNQVADRESRSKADSSEWALDGHILMDKRGPCTVDLFASRLSAKLPTYYSWRLDPGATAVDALCQPLGMSIGYAFLPFCLIGRCLAKITSEKVPRIILITPLWKSQA